jgi:hypothetical protein
MHCLTVCQPYAALIADGSKGIENRTWSTRYRGPIGIHAGKSRAYLNDYPYDKPMVFGALVAVVHLFSCVHIERLEQFAERYPQVSWIVGHEHAEGPYCWILTDVHALLTPVPMNGAQSLWHCPDDVLRCQDLMPVPGPDSRERK